MRSSVFSKLAFLFIATLPIIQAEARSETFGGTPAAPNVTTFRFQGDEGSEGVDQARRQIRELVAGLMTEGSVCAYRESHNAAQSGGAKVLQISVVTRGYDNFQYLHEHTRSLNKEMVEIVNGFDQKCFFND